MIIVSKTEELRDKLQKTDNNNPYFELPIYIQGKDEVLGHLAINIQDFIKN